MPDINLWEDTYETDGDASKSSKVFYWRKFLAKYAQWYLSPAGATLVIIQRGNTLIDRILFPIWYRLYRRYTLPTMTYATLNGIVNDMVAKKAVPILGKWYSVRIEEYRGGDDGN